MLKWKQVYRVSFWEGWLKDNYYNLKLYCAAYVDKDDREIRKKNCKKSLLEVL